MAPGPDADPQKGAPGARPSREDCGRLLADLEREHQFCRGVMDAVRVPIYVVDPKTYRILDCNQVFLSEYNLSGRDQAVGRTCYQTTRRRKTPCASSQEDCPLLGTVATGRPAMHEFIYAPPQGGEAVIECTTTPVLDRKGQVTRVIFINRDITHRLRTEEQLRNANRQLQRTINFLRNLINSSVDAVIASDLSGRILVFNEAAQKITGYSEEEALQELDIRDIYPGDTAREIMRKLRSDDYGGKGKLDSHEVYLKGKHGVQMPISLSAALVYDGEREVSSVGFFYDLREKKRMERELDMARVQLLQSEKMASIGKLAAGVAHQLNNPLSGITLYSHILSEEYELPEGAGEDLKRILAGAERCRNTVKELLQFARQTTKEIRPADLNQAITRTLFLLENQALFQNIDIVRDLDPKLPEVPADIQQLNHVFMNLILNAAEAMDGQGRLEVKTSLSPNGDAALVEITDTGPGIPEQVLGHLFEPFFTTKEEGKGTGLGLSVAYGIIENHGGKISADNRPRGGARFLIELPLSSGTQKT